MEWLPPALDAYCRKHTVSPSQICEEIETYTKAHVSGASMLIGPMEASVLGLFIRSIQAKRVLEIGCFTGYSALAMAEHLPEDGELITLDINVETVELAKSFWKKSPHGKKIKAVVGPALRSLESLQGPFDFIFVDADKENYPLYFNAGFSVLAPRGVMAFDNMLWSGRVIEENPDAETKALQETARLIKSTKGLCSSLLPVRDGLMIVMRS